MAAHERMLRVERRGREPLRLWALGSAMALEPINMHVHFLFSRSDFPNLVYVLTAVGITFKPSGTVLCVFVTWFMLGREFVVCYIQHGELHFKVS